MMDKEVRIASDYLKRGRIILYPTDTIWGIGCDATSPEPVDQIYRIKQRSDTKSMLVLVSGFEMLRMFVKKVPEQAVNIIKSAHKPTTIIYPDAINLAPNLLATDGSVGIRITADHFCHQLIGHLGKPLVSTSANFSGEPPPGTFTDIDPGIRSQADHVVQWRQDDTTLAAPSAIIKLDVLGKVTVLRP